MVNTVVAGDAPLSPSTEDTLDFAVSSIDEDMLAYLYPLGNILDGSYSMDTLRELPNFQLNIQKGSSEIEFSLDRPNVLLHHSKSVLPNELGDAVTGPAYTHSDEVPGKSACIFPEPLTSKDLRVPQSNSTDKSRASISSGYQSTVATHSPMLPSNCQPIDSSVSLSSSAIDTGSLNFAYFSRLAALPEANLQALGVWGTRNADHCQQLSRSRYMQENVQDGILLTESTGKSQSHSYPRNGGCGHGAIPELASSGQPNAASCELSLSITQEKISLEEKKKTQNGNSTESNCKNIKLVNQQCSNTMESFAYGEKSSQSVAEAIEAFGQTITSQTCSGNSAEGTNNELLMKGRKKLRERGHPAKCQSQTAEDDAVELKKPVRRSASSKRTRAAEVHNLSERRRRDRINEKMKALQELIPNSNKTDKASMLDEAIEYLKMLQLQLQMMSLKSGLSIPPLVVSPGLQHHAMPQMVGPIDMGSSGPVCPLLVLPSRHGPSLLAKPLTMGSIEEHASGPPVVDFYNRLLTGQQFQIPIQHINMNLYHPYMLQQQQQQPQPQQRQQIHGQRVYGHLPQTGTAACGSS